MEGYNECKKCGLLKATIESTGTACLGGSDHYYGSDALMESAEKAGAVIRESEKREATDIGFIMTDLFNDMQRDVASSHHLSGTYFETLMDHIIKYRDAIVPKEICICAAVLATDGTVIRGHRHADALNKLRGMPNKEYRYGNGDTQGFVTSMNRYVTREEGYKLQIDAGILSADPGGYRYSELYSEDLY